MGEIIGVYDNCARGTEFGREIRSIRRCHSFLRGIKCREAFTVTRAGVSFRIGNIHG